MLLITGATGKVGSNLAYMLKDAEVKLRLMMRDTSRLHEVFKDSDCELVAADYENRESLAKALDDVDKVFLVTPGDQRLVDFEQSFIEEAKNAGIEHIVKLSVIGADSKSAFSTGRWHFAAEQYLESSGIAYTHLRPHSLMQNFFSYRSFIKREGVFLAPMGNGRIPLIDARDVAAVAAVCLMSKGHEGMVYELTGPEPLTYNQAAEIMSEKLEMTIKYVDMPLDQTRKTMTEGGWPPWMVDDVISLYQYFRDGLASRTTDTVEALTQRPAMNFAQFITDYAEFFKSNAE